jgi:hypothetical protein
MLPLLSRRLPYDCTQASKKRRHRLRAGLLVDEEIDWDGANALERLDMIHLSKNC